MPCKGLYAADACCFMCSLNLLKSTIDSMIHKLPEGAWEKAVKDRMVLPLLRSLTLLDPLRRMPLHWLTEAQPEMCDMIEKDRVILLYWELCLMVKKGPKASKKNYFITMHTWALNITHIIITSHVVSPEEYWGLREQIYILDGFDGVLTEIKDVVSRGGRGLALNLESSAQYIYRCGAMEYALFLIEKMTSLVMDKMTPSAHHNEKMVLALEQLRNALLKIQENESAKIHTLRMALHSRVKGTPIKALGSDLLQLCVEKTKRKPILLWEDVLEEWLAPLMQPQALRG